MIILASKSPRRKELLSKLNLPFITYGSQVDETIGLNKTHKELAKELFYKKTLTTQNTFKDNIIGS